MPRADRTFSDQDVIRIWETSLTKKEKKKVEEFFFERSLQKGGLVFGFVGAATSAVYQIFRKNPAMLNPKVQELTDRITERVIRRAAEDVCRGVLEGVPRGTLESLEENLRGENQAD